jgi:hypothetical protein
MVTQPPHPSHHRAIAPDHVLTPGGFRHKSLVHAIERGEAVRRVNHRHAKVQLKTGALMQLTVSAPDVAIPAMGSGWVASAGWTNDSGAPVTSFATTWRVPPPPAVPADQTVFLFNGIQNTGASCGILQPVLQWGVSAAGGGQWWSIGNWYVTSDGSAFHKADLRRVEPGELLVGVMSLVEQGNGKFTYESEFQGYPDLTLRTEEIAELVWCVETLEAYQISDCRNYPATARTAMLGIDIQTSVGEATLRWSPQIGDGGCGQEAIVVSNASPGGEVDLCYSGAPQV